MVTRLILNAYHLRAFRYSEKRYEEKLRSRCFEYFQYFPLNSDHSFKFMKNQFNFSERMSLSFLLRLRIILFVENTSLLKVASTSVHRIHRGKWKFLSNRSSNASPTPFEFESQVSGILIELISSSKAIVSKTNLTSSSWRLVDLRVLTETNLDVFRRCNEDSDCTMKHRVQ